MSISRDVLNFAFIGCGEMGSAILRGWLGSNNGPLANATALNFHIVEHSEHRRLFLASDLGVNCYSNASELPLVDVLVIAVRPNDVADILKDVSANPNLSNALVISIAAGIKTSTIAENLGSGNTVIRVMPNLPLEIGRGVCTACSTDGCKSDELAFVCSLFSLIGKCFEVKEEQMDLCTAISGCGPAYVAELINHLSRAGHDLGLDKSLSYQLALNTVIGTSCLLEQTNVDACDLSKQVAVEGGVTRAALDAMDESGMYFAYRSGVEAAVKKSKELS